MVIPLSKEIHSTDNILQDWINLLEEDILKDVQRVQQCHILASNLYIYRYLYKNNVY